MFNWRTTHFIAKIYLYHSEWTIWPMGLLPSLSHLIHWQQKSFSEESQRAKVKICSPLPAMMTSPYEWKILKWDKKIIINNMSFIFIFQSLDGLSQNSLEPQTREMSYCWRNRYHFFLNYNIWFKILKVLYACAKKVGAQDRVKLTGIADLKHFMLI